MDILEQQKEQLDKFVLSYQEALDALDEGKMVARKHWLTFENGPMFLVATRKRTIKRESVGSEETLPDSLKKYIDAYLQGDLNISNGLSIFHVNSVTLSDGWQASYGHKDSDTEAKDWGIIL